VAERLQHAMKAGLLLLALAGGALVRSSAAAGGSVELDPNSFGNVLPKPGDRPLLLFLSRPGCAVCDQLSEKWAAIAEGVGRSGMMATMNCDSEKPENERFCFSLQSPVCWPLAATPSAGAYTPALKLRNAKCLLVPSAPTCAGLQELSQMDFPRLLLFHESKIYLMGKQVYMAPSLTHTTADFVRGGYVDRGALEGTYDASKQCLPGAGIACQVDFSFGAGLPVREDCMDLYKQCGEYKEAGKCEMYKNVCEISCGVCRPPPSGKPDL
jgi:hypothetical protein